MAEPIRGRPGMKEVAERAGVAMSSVSRALSGHPDVSEVMRNRVLDAARSLGYTPNLLAQSLRTGSTMAVGFVAINIANPVVARNAAAAERLLRDAGYTLLLADSGGDKDLDADNIRQLVNRRVDGLLLAVADETNKATLGELAEIETPVVLVDRSVATGRPAGAVLFDHAAGMTAAVTSLLELGHRRIALIAGSKHVRPTIERAATIRKVLRGVPGTSATIRYGAYSAEHGYAAAISLLESTEPPTALIAGGNQMLPGVLAAIRDAGLLVPTDLSLVTIDRSALGAFLDPPTATITRDHDELGRQAAILLLDQMAGREPRTVVIPTGFEATASIAPPKAHR